MEDEQAGARRGRGPAGQVTAERAYAMLLDERTARLDAMLLEADRRYEQRFGSILDALVAQKEAVNVALVAADRAVAKAELASSKQFDALDEKINTVVTQLSVLAGRSSGISASWTVMVSVVGIVLASSALIVTILRTLPTVAP